MRNFTSYYAKTFDLAKKLNFILILLFLLGASISSNAQPSCTEVGFCSDDNSNTINDYCDGTICTGTSLGVLEGFALFTSTGAVSNAGMSNVNGHVGTNVGALTGFGLPTTLNGTAFAPGTTTAQAVIDVQLLYNGLQGTTIPPGPLHAPAFGSGEILAPGVYTIAGAGSVVGDLILDGQGKSDAFFLFKFAGAFTAAAASKVELINGAKACNVSWISGGAIVIGASTKMKGTFISNPGAITMVAGGELEGRLLSTTGAISISTALILAPCVPAPAGTPCDDGNPSTYGGIEDGNGNCEVIDCPAEGVACNDGDASTENDLQDGECNCVGTPLPLYLGTMENFALFTSNGALSNAGESDIWGSVGTNIGATAGFGSPTCLNGGTTQAATSATADGVTDLLNLYGQLVATSPTNSSHAAAFGGGEILDPGVYAIAGAGSVGGELKLNGDADAVFIFKFGGAFTTGANAKVTLTGGVESCNVFWISPGAIAMAANTEIVGTIISGPGAVSMAVGGILEGRLLSTSGAIAISGAIITNPCGSHTSIPCSSSSFAIPNNQYFNASKEANDTPVDQEVNVYPNPAADNIRIALRSFAGKAGTIEIYNNLGQKVKGRNYLSFPTIPTVFDVSGLTNGMYMISIEVKDHKRFTKKFIVNK
jgi:hypothetical protein